MSKTITNCVVVTESNKDRKRLIDFLTEKEKLVSITNESDGFQLIGITMEHGIGFLGVICAENLVNKCGYTLFSSVDDFIYWYEN